MFCPHCNSQIADDAKVCPSCGHRLGPAHSAHLAPARRRKVPAALIAVLVVALVAVAGAGVWFAFFAPYQLDGGISFADASIRAAAAVWDADGDGVLSREEARAATSLEVENAGEVKGLGAIFPNLERLSVSGDAATVDVSDLGALTALSVETAQSQTVDLSHNPKLDELSLSNEVQVTGLEATGLEEHWLVAGVAESYDGASTITYSAEYDAQGRATSTLMEAPLEGVSSLREYTYDDDRVVSVDETFSGRSGEGTKRTFAYAYDAEGFVVSCEDESANYGRYYKYDDAGRLAWYGDGRIDDVSNDTSYTYDDQGCLVKAVNAYEGDFEEGDPSVFTYEYDDQGRCVRKTDYAGEEWALVTNYEFDDQGRVTRAYCEDNEGSYPTTFSYDDQGRIVSAEAQMEGTLTTATLSYGDDGLLTGASVATTAAAGNHEVDYDLTYTRRFVSAEETPGISLALGVPEAPLIMAQHMSLVDVFAVPAIDPDPTPHAFDGYSLTPLF